MPCLSKAHATLNQECVCYLSIADHEVDSLLSQVSSSLYAQLFYCCLRHATDVWYFSDWQLANEV